MSRLVIVFSALLPWTAAQGQSNQSIPDPLKSWTEWVMEGHEDELCPTPFNQPDQSVCAWAGPLELEATDRGARFTQTWHVTSETWVPLPGSPLHWPQNVKVGERSIPVTSRQAPSCRLQPGLHRLSGQFSWKNLPPYLEVPPINAWIKLSRDGRAISAPNIDNDSKLWFKAPAAAREEQDAMDLRVFRWYADRVPAELVTRIELDVAGKHREESVGPFLPTGFRAVEVNGQIPTFFDDSGILHMQVRPGEWTINVRAISREHHSEIQLVAASNQWVDEEVWSLEFHPEIRQVSMPLATTIDPTQTLMPDPWKQYQAVLLKPGETLSFTEHARGFAQLEPDQVTIDRTIWLDFGGGGYTVRDQLSGVLRQTWRMQVADPFELGHVTLNGNDQLITSDEANRAGFEVRQGALEAVCESRIEQSTRRLPAVAWNTPATSLYTQLNLPPGWTLFHASGVDRASGSWINRWTLYDLFLVLIISFATSHLFTRKLAGAMALMLVLTYHESGAPRWVWVAILVAIALERALPKGWFRTVILWLKRASFGILILIAFTFCVRHIKHGMFPHLSSSYRQMDAFDYVSSKAESYEVQAYEQEEAPPQKSRFRKKIMIDPDAAVQTGPGMPSWSWRSVNLSWNGPVAPNDQIRLTLIPPLANTLLAFLRCALILFVGAMLLALKRKSKVNVPRASALAAWLILPLAMAATPLKAQLPNQELLDELRARLIQPDDCFPLCASLEQAAVTIDSQNYQWDLTYHMETESAVPLPGPTSTWIIRSIDVDGSSATGCVRMESETWLLLPQGVHQVRVRGLLTARDNAVLSFSLQPYYVTVHANDWVTEIGDTEAKRQLVFNREQSQSSAGEDRRYDQQVFPSQWSVERTVTMGLEWTVDTTIRRLSQGHTGSVLTVPLIPGETVITGDVQVKDAQVRVNLTPNDRSFTWHSALAPSDQISLTAATEGTYVETWRLDASPIWHVETEGIPPLHYLDASGEWQPQWAPWPGESIGLTISRPKTTEGVTTTIDSTQLNVEPGPRATQFALSFSVKSSRGDRISITLPEGSEPPAFSVNGSSKPYTLNGADLSLQLPTGASSVELQWRVMDGISTLYQVPEIRVNQRSVNNGVQVQMPHRWTLLTSYEDLGPVVLFWSFVIVLAFFSWGLGRLEFTPLKARHWFLLGIGISQISPIAIFFIFAWILLLGSKKFYAKRPAIVTFNLGQIALAGVTLLALALLLGAIQQGLLGSPNMQIAGNGSYHANLNWYTEQSDGVLPTPWVFSVSIWFYKLAMLAWSLWMAKSLVGWLKWGWSQFSEGGLWRRKPKVKPAVAYQPVQQTPPDQPSS